jgi:hypothetical protein
MRSPMDTALSSHLIELSPSDGVDGYSYNARHAVRVVVA